MWKATAGGASDAFALPAIKKKEDGDSSSSKKKTNKKAKA